MTVATVTVTGASRAQAKGSDVTGDRVPRHGNTSGI